METQKQQETFTSRWGLLLAALGMAVGTGNIWRFPRIAAQNGGGEFLIAWVIFLFTWSVPLLIAEFAIGKHTRKGTIGAFGKLIGEKYGWMGGFVGFCTFAIMFYYSVVTGWCLKYLSVAVTSGFTAMTPEISKQTFAVFIDSYQPIIFHVITMGLAAWIIYRGIASGLERANKVLLPGIFIVLIISAVWSLTEPNARGGLEFFFHPDFEALADYKIWLEALTQSAWSTGAGWGLILTYAVYMKQKEDVGLNSFVVGFGDNSASLLAGIVIFSTVFSLVPGDAAILLQSSGRASTGLTFEWLPALFSEMPGGFIFAIMFFLALFMAAFSSLISMVELAVRNFMDAGMGRSRAIIYVGIAGVIFGIPSALSSDFFENQDWVWGIGLMVSGMLVAFAVIRYGVDKFRTELINGEGADFKIGKWYNVVILVLIPLQFIAMISWWFYKAISDFAKDDWWDPTNIYSVGTCVVQWLLVIVLFMIFNKKIMGRILRQ
ncbi:sodium-dependent transporter [bacterium]|nr:sodium-dependent transporter [bacterium]